MVFTGSRLVLSPFQGFTFLGQVLIHDQLSVPKVVQDGSEVSGVPVDEVGPRLVLQSTTFVNGYKTFIFL